MSVAAQNQQAANPESGTVKLRLAALDDDQRPGATALLAVCNGSIFVGALSRGLRLLFRRRPSGNRVSYR
jgi:hypothetical protein